MTNQTIETNLTKNEKIAFRGLLAQANQIAPVLEDFDRELRTVGISVEKMVEKMELDNTYDSILAQLEKLGHDALLAHDVFLSDVDIFNGTNGSRGCMGFIHGSRNMPCFGRGFQGPFGGTCVCED